MDKTPLNMPRGTFLVSHSTKRSPQSHALSALAICEVLVAVLASCAYAIYTQGILHIWIGVFFAPLLLMRSAPSIALGIAWFESYGSKSSQFRGAPLTKILRSPEAWIAATVAMATAMLCSYFLASWWSGGTDTLLALLYGFLIGSVALQAGIAAGVAISIGGAVALAGRKTEAGAKSGAIGLALVVALAIGGAAAWAGASWQTASVSSVSFMAMAAIGTSRLGPILGVFFLGFSFGTWIRSAVIRFSATARHARAGFWEIPRNFQRTLFIVDSCSPTELIPGFRGDNHFSKQGVFRRFQRPLDESDKRFDRLVSLIFFCFGNFYRLSIKSTFIVYLPLVYVAGHRYAWYSSLHLFERLRWAPIERLRLFVACCTALVFAMVNIYYNIPELMEFIKLGPISILEFLFVIDLQSWSKPWQICSLTSAAISFYLATAAGGAHIDYKYLVDPRDVSSFTRKSERLKVLMRLRDVSSAFWIAFILVDAVLLFSSTNDVLPVSLLKSLAEIYGEPGWRIR